MNADTTEYRLQLMQVERSILCTQNEDERNELLALKDNLIELLALTSETQDEHSYGAIEQTNNSVESVLNDLSMKAHNFPEHLNEEEKLDLLKNKCEKLLGEKCSAPFRHTWGALIYHNAIISSIESLSLNDSTVTVKLKVLFINPTHREMVPCNYYLEGNCRFEEKSCRFSHGESVYANDLKKYAAPDFERLTTNCFVLAKLPNRVWNRGRVLYADFVEKKCRVRLEDIDKAQQDCDFEFQDLLPIYHDEKLNESSNDVESECEDYILPLRSSINGNISKNLFACDEAHHLGEWEKHTKGIGSKLMAQMGYIPGRGLGQNGRGIITPISAQILPPRRSLDHCMALREAANGDEDLFSIEKKIAKIQKKQEALNIKAYEKECQRADVFSFLNNNILLSDQGAMPISSKSHTQNKSTHNTSLEKYSTKSLNVKSVRITNEIKHKQKEILEMKKSLKRNTHSIKIYTEIERKLNVKAEELRALKNEESYLEKEQSVRKNKEILSIF